MTAATMEGSDIAVSHRPKHLTVRLSVLIFIGFAIMGSWVPVFSLHLKNLGFSAEATAWASATSALGSLIAPLIWGQIADRWLAMERCISLCALASAVGLLLIPRLADPFQPWVIFVACLGLWIFLIPTIGLTSSLIFRQLEHPERDFGKVRVWGTLGWIVIGWCLTGWYTHAHAGAEADTPADFAVSMHLGAAAAFVLACYALTLPHTPPNRHVSSGTRRRSWLAGVADAPLAALRLFRERSFVVYCVSFFGLYVTIPFTAQMNPLLLADLGIERAALPMVLTIAQSTEVIFLFLLPVMLGRLGAKTTMVLGIAVWTGELALLGLDLRVGVILAASAAHGVFICCFLVAGQVFVNRQATHDIRASAQGILLFISGSGLLLGHVGVGWIRDLTGENYRLAYFGASVLSAAMLLLFLAGFVSPRRRAISSQETLVPGSEIT